MCDVKMSNAKVKSADVADISSFHLHLLKVFERIGVRGKENFSQKVFLPPPDTHIHTNTPHK